MDCMFVYPAVGISNVGGTNQLSWRTKSYVGACVGAVLMWRGEEGLGLCHPGDEVQMHVSGVSCSVDYLHLVRYHRSAGERIYVTLTCAGSG